MHMCTLSTGVNGACYCPKNSQQVNEHVDGLMLTQTQNTATFHSKVLLLKFGT